MANKSIPESELSDLIKLARQALREAGDLQNKIEQIYSRLVPFVEPDETQLEREQKAKRTNEHSGGVNNGN